MFKNAFHCLLSRRKVWTGIPGPGHFSKVLLCFKRTRSHQGCICKDIPAHPVPLFGGVEILSAMGLMPAASPDPPRCPPQPVWEGGWPTTCTVLEGTFPLPAQWGSLPSPPGLGSGEQRAVGTSVEPGLLETGVQAHGVICAVRKLQNKERKALAHLASVGTGAEIMLIKVPLLTWQKAEGLCQLSPPVLPYTHTQTHTHKLSCPALCNPGDQVPSSPTSMSAGLTTLLPQSPHRGPPAFPITTNRTSLTLGCEQADFSLLLFVRYRRGCPYFFMSMLSVAYGHIIYHLCGV